MSWSIGNPKLLNGELAASEARQAVIDDQYVPQTMKDYIISGIDGLVNYYAGGPEGSPVDPKVKVTGHGHVCQGPGSYNVTSATIDVRPAE